MFYEGKLGKKRPFEHLLGQASMPLPSPHLILISSRFSDFYGKENGDEMTCPVDRGGIQTLICPYLGQCANQR